MLSIGLAAVFVFCAIIFEGFIFYDEYREHFVVVFYCQAIILLLLLLWYKFITLFQKTPIWKLLVVVIVLLVDSFLIAGEVILVFEEHASMHR